MIVNQDGYDAVFRDIRDGLSRWRFWLTYGLRDAASALPRRDAALIFIPFQTAVVVAVFWAIFHDTLGRDLFNYAAYVALGYPLFALLIGSISTNTSLIKKNAGILANMPFPIFAFVLRGSTQLIAAFLLSALVYCALVIAGIAPLPHEAPLAILGFVLVMLIVVANTLAFSLLSLYVPNAMAVVRSFSRFLFFATPVVWHPAGSGFRETIVLFNPLAHLIALVRDPLLGVTPPLLSWGIGLAFLVLSSAFALYALKRVRRYIVFRI